MLSVASVCDSSRCPSALSSLGSGLGDAAREAEWLLGEGMSARPASTCDCHSLAAAPGCCECTGQRCVRGLSVLRGLLSSSLIPSARRLAAACRVHGQQQQHSVSEATRTSYSSLLYLPQQRISQRGLLLRAQRTCKSSGIDAIVASSVCLIATQDHFTGNLGGGSRSAWTPVRLCAKVLQGRRLSDSTLPERALASQ